MKGIPENSVDLVLTDPPYGMLHCAWDAPFDIPAFWDGALRALKPSGAVVMTAMGMFSARMVMSMPRLYKYKWIWAKRGRMKNFLNARRQPLRVFEEVLVFCGGQPEYHPQMLPGEPYARLDVHRKGGAYNPSRASDSICAGGRFPVDVLRLDYRPGGLGRQHPTEKPVELGRYMVRTYTSPGALVLDCFCGSGAFCAAAAMEGRRCIGIEMDESFAGAARDRMAALGTDGPAW
jgi:site-specific DNA-methyltransferase (adenine-specific)/modification methylase